MAFYSVLGPWPSWTANSIKGQHLVLLLLQLHKFLWLVKICYKRLLFLRKCILYPVTIPWRVAPLTEVQWTEQSLPCAFISSMCLFKEVNLALAWSFSFFILLSAAFLSSCQRTMMVNTQMFIHHLSVYNKVILSRHHLAVLGKSDSLLL